MIWGVYTKNDNLIFFFYGVMECFYATWEFKYNPYIIILPWYYLINVASQN